MLARRCFPIYLKQGKRKDGRIYLVLAKSIRDPVAKISRTVTVESLGYLDELEKKHSDPIAFFTAEALRRTAEETEGTKPVLLKINPKETLSLALGQRKNLGFAVISRIFHQLDLDSFFLTKQRDAGFEFNALSIAKLLIYSRRAFLASYLVQKFVAQWRCFLVWERIVLGHCLVN